MPMIDKVMLLKRALIETVIGKLKFLGKLEHCFSDKKMMKRRSAIEPIIGDLRHFGRLGRNYLRGII